MRRRGGRGGGTHGCRADCSQSGARDGTSGRDGRTRERTAAGVMAMGGRAQAAGVLVERHAAGTDAEREQAAHGELGAERAGEPPSAASRTGPGSA
jgi:hypothetical protein